MTQDGPDLVPCPKCGSEQLVSLDDPRRLIVVAPTWGTWARPLTTEDKRFLRSIRVSDTS